MPVQVVKCPLCLSSFRTESGMKWHLMHKHEVPAAMDAIGKEYKVQIEELQVQIDQLKQEVSRYSMLFNIDI